jgi:hypothetical protein
LAPGGRFISADLSPWGVWKFSKNKTAAAKELLEWLSEREQAKHLIAAGQGYDVPVFQSMTDFDIWTEAGPPKGKMANYPVKPQHDAKLVTSAWPAPRSIAVHIRSTYLLPKIIARIPQSGKTVDDTLAWAEGEIEGYRAKPTARLWRFLHRGAAVFLRQRAAQRWLSDQIVGSRFLWRMVNAVTASAAETPPTSVRSAWSSRAAAQVAGGSAPTRVAPRQVIVAVALAEIRVWICCVQQGELQRQGCSALDHHPLRDAGGATEMCC